MAVPYFQVLSFKFIFQGNGPLGTLPLSSVCIPFSGLVIFLLSKSLDTKKALPP